MCEAANHVTYTLEGSSQVQRDEQEEDDGLDNDTYIDLSSN
jgi:hypothetical protein